MAPETLELPSARFPDASAPLRLPALLLIAACNLVVGSGAMIVTGLLTPIAGDFMVSPAAAGQLITAYALAFAISAPVVAVLAARVCRKRLLVYALSAFGATTLGAALAPDITLMWMARALGGISAAAFVPNASAVVGALATPETRGRALAIVFGGFTLAMVLGAPLGTWLGLLIGWREAIATLGLLALAAALALKRLLPSGIMLPGASRANLVEAMTRLRLLALIGTNALASFGSLALFAFAAVAFPAYLESPPSIIGAAFLVFGLGNLLGNVVSVWALDRLGPATTATAGFALSACTLGLLVFQLGAIYGWLALLVWGFASFAAGTAHQARLIACAPSLASALLPLNSSAIFLGQAVGAVAGGWVLSNASSPPQALAGMASAALCAAAIASFWLAKTKHVDESRSANDASKD